ncbi:MAG TPA: STAS domain-containing protein [Anaeromyxobacter sp.]
MLHVRFEQLGDALVVTPLARRLDAAAAAAFVAAVREQVRHRPRVVVSLAHVVAVDASGLAALVAVHQLMPPGSELRLAHAPAAARALLEATSLDHLFPAFDDAAAALDA